MERLKLADTSRAFPLLSAASSAHRRCYPVTSDRFQGCGCAYVSFNQRNNARLRKRLILRTQNSASVEPSTQQTLKSPSNQIQNPASGDSIRSRFLNFFASKGHKILPSSSLVPDDPTVFLTIAGMLQFKPIFLGKEPRSVPCATTSQKCMRTNDIENVGRTARHHTFFEMLGNFSFGDYFKKEAIHWAWELITKEYGLPPERLWISVFQDDDEAFSIWHNEVGVPKERIKRMGEEDNFWTSGPTGPCGPCSEIYYDFAPEKGFPNADLGDDSRFIEFYNLVFMQYNKKDDGSLEPLKQKNIDTGMGLERMAQILQNVPNNYETDLIFPIIERAAEMAMIKYSEADESTKANLKVIGDHMRAVVYLISDGVMPSNIGRGYVVRRLLRRVVRTGRLIGIQGDGTENSNNAFSPVLAQIVIDLSPQIDSDVKSRKKVIFEELRREELRFVQTLERGERLLGQFLDEALNSTGEDKIKGCISGKDAFLLYDTFGFPIEITSEIANEKGVIVDLEGFKIEMENQRKTSQNAHNFINLSVTNETELLEGISDTKFTGYDSLYNKAIIKGILVNGNPVINVSEGAEVEVLLDKTPFYAESGGQVGDNGFLRFYEGGNENVKTVVEVKDVQKCYGNIFAHRGVVKEGSLQVGAEIDAEVNSELRKRAKAHHTATHLLQSALKAIIGQETSQAGSLVTFERLRFDFNFHRPLTDEEITDIEALVNLWIGQGTDLETQVMDLVDAKQAGAIAMFGEKYSSQVRVVSVPGVSMELCGGTHVANTSEIRGFMITSEQGIASGIRRIEAVAGDSFIEHVTTRDRFVRRLTASLKVKPEDLNSRVESIAEELRGARNEVASLRSRIAVLRAENVTDRALIVGPQNIRVVVENMEDTDPDALRKAAEYLTESLGDPVAIVLGSVPVQDKVSLVASFSPSVVKLGVQAGRFIGNIAKLCGGGGGGKPNFAQAGGRNPAMLDDALARAKQELVDSLSKI